MSWREQEPTPIEDIVAAWAELIAQQPHQRRRHKSWLLWMAVQRTLLAPRVEEIRRMSCWSRMARKVPIHIRQWSILQGMGEFSSGRVIIYATGRLNADIATIIHELSHADTWFVRDEGHHGPTWRSQYAAAVAEYLGQPIELPKSRFDLNGGRADQLVEERILQHLERRHARDPAGTDSQQGS